jgi:hypothetical protein
MLPVRRRLLNLLTALSLLLSVAVCSLWVRSLTVADWLSHSRGTSAGGRYARTEWILLSGQGSISLIKKVTVPVDDPSEGLLRRLDEESGLGWSFGPVDGYPFSWQGLLEGFRRIGIDSGRDATRGTSTVKHWTSAVVPHGLVLLIVCVPALPTAFRLCRRLRRRRGHCPQCGYDLTGNVSGVCSECGRDLTGGRYGPV